MSATRFPGRRHPVAHGFAVLVTTLLLASCTTATMRPSAGLEDAEAWAVDGHSPRWRNSTLRFGPHQVRSVDEGTRLDWAVELLGTGAQLAGASRRYAFELEPASGGRRVACREAELGVRKRGYEIDAAAVRDPRLACAIRGADGTLRLALDAAGPRFEGTAVHGERDRRYGIRSVHAFAESGWTSAEPLGFELTVDGRTVAAVETINAGRVWLSPRLGREQEADVAAVVAALLLFRPDGGNTVGA